MILEQAERDRVQQLLCETLPAICQASLSGFADIKVDALIGITLNKSDVFLVSIKETCHPDGAVDIDEGKGGRPSKVNKIIAKTEVSTKRTSGRGRRKKAKRAASESEEEYIPSKKASQRGENDELDTSTTAAEQSEGSPRKRSRAQRKSAVKAEASFQEQEPDDDEAPELPPHGTAEFSDDDFVGDDTGDYSDMDNDDETEMTDIRQQIDNQQASLDKMMIKQEPDSTDRTSTADGDDDFLDRPFTASKASDDQMENTDEQDTSSNKQMVDENEINDTESTGAIIYYSKDKDGTFRCNKCDFTSQHHGSIHRHSQKHSGTRYSCTMCKARFVSRFTLKSHMSKAHKVKRVCSICSKTFRSTTGYNTHMAQHLNQLKHCCSFCDRKFPTKQSLEGHENKHKKQKPHVCPKCCNRYTYRASLNTHMKECDGPKKKKDIDTACGICGQVFSCINSLKEHKKAKHSNTVLRCQICSAAFQWRQTYRRHMKRCKEKHGIVDEKPKPVKGAQNDAQNSAQNDVQNDGQNSAQNDVQNDAQATIEAIAEPHVDALSNLQDILIQTTANENDKTFHNI